MLRLNVRTSILFLANTIFTWCAVFCPFDQARGNSSFDATAVLGIPTAGPNCYFTALNANSLLKVPAVMMSADSAALLLLNPALCKTVRTLEPGDISLTEEVAALKRKDLYHASTFVGPNRWFEKASPYKSAPFQFVNTPALPPTRFVRCRPMQNWVNASLAKIPRRLVQLNQSLDEIERLIDARNINASTYAILETKMQNLSARYDDPRALVQEALVNQLKQKGISPPPIPKETENYYYRFAVGHPDLVSDQMIFAYMWLSSRLETIYYIFQNNQRLEAAQLLQ